MSVGPPHCTCEVVVKTELGKETAVDVDADTDVNIYKRNYEFAECTEE